VGAHVVAVGKLEYLERERELEQQQQLVERPLPARRIERLELQQQLGQRVR